jgi:type VI secretion system protein ImpJ
VKPLLPVIWTKGTFLTPQHLQTQDRFLENLLQFHVENLSFLPRGFRSLRISQASLDAGALGLSTASGILPDGLLFDIPDSDFPPAPKQLADCFGPDQSSVDVYLAIPHYSERGVNVAASVKSGARYYAEPMSFRDENTGAAERPVQIARKNLRLLTEAEVHEGYATLRLARILRTETGTFQLDPRFVPPLLDFRASDYLVSIARGLVEILSARSGEIAGARRQRNQTLADFTAADIPNFWLLYTINTALPMLRHLFETRGGQPETLFSVMTSLAGALTTFSTEIHPRDLPAYDHDDLGGCFTDLNNKLRALLEAVVPSNFVSLPLKLTQPSIYATSIDQDKYLANTKMYLAVNAGATKAEIIAKTPLLLKVCSGSHIEHVVRRALPGVTLTYVASPPSAIPVKLNYHYFSLNQSGASWEGIVSLRNLAAYVPSDLPTPQLELIILLPQAT